QREEFEMPKWHSTFGFGFLAAVTILLSAPPSGQPFTGSRIGPEKQAIGLVSDAGTDGKVAPDGATDCVVEGAAMPGDRIILAQQGCCSSHGGVCGCGADGRTLCCDATPSPTCHCTPTPHTLTITNGPSGSSNPVASEGATGLSVTAVDSQGHA